MPKINDAMHAKADLFYSTCNPVIFWTNVLAVVFFWIGSKYLSLPTIEAPQIANMKKESFNTLSKIL